MLQQAIDLLAEADELSTLLRPLPDADYERVTAFKHYTINDVLRHLHQGDYMGELAIEGREAFETWYRGRQQRRAAGVSTRDDARLQFGHLAGRALHDAWRAKLDVLADKLGRMDQNARLPWAGPDMGVKMFTTARQMEVWAHGQEIFDVLGRERQPTDRLKNIAVIGVRTFGWTFANRGLPVPETPPYVRLTAPSGAVWEWNPPSDRNAVLGNALEFCQVVTQVRNIADTHLRVIGETAQRWMAMAQCFAGPPETPPPPGLRRRADVA
jgi:uncharacterized protein (TIGR03084 family)